MWFVETKWMMTASKRPYNHDASYMSSLVSKKTGAKASVKRRKTMPEQGYKWENRQCFDWSNGWMMRLFARKPSQSKKRQGARERVDIDQGLRRSAQELYSEKYPKHKNIYKDMVDQFIYQHLRGDPLADMEEMYSFLIISDSDGEHGLAIARRVPVLFQPISAFCSVNDPLLATTVGFGGGARFCNWGACSCGYCRIHPRTPTPHTYRGCRWCTCRYRESKQPHCSWLL